MHSDGLRGFSNPHKVELTVESINYQLQMGNSYYLIVREVASGKLKVYHHNLSTELVTDHVTIFKVIKEFNKLMGDDM